MLFSRSVSGDMASSNPPLRQAGYLIVSSRLPVLLSCKTVAQGPSFRAIPPCTTTDRGGSVSAIEKIERED